MAIVPTDALRVVVPLCATPTGAAGAVLTHVQARKRGKMPLPRRADLHVTVAEAGKEPFTLVIPIAVWPSWWLLLSVGFITVAGPLVANRFFELTRSMNPFHALGEIATDASFVSATVAFAILAAGALKLIGWVAVWAGWIAGDSE